MSDGRRFLFIGEKPSITAHDRGIVWADGKLAAKQLFDALRKHGIDPARCMFVNLFGDRPDEPETAPVIIPKVQMINILATVNRLDIVAMGLKVSRTLQPWAIPHRTIVHPAARGAIRKKERYAQHIHDVLLSPSLFSGTVAPKLVGPDRARRLAVAAEA